MENVDVAVEDEDWEIYEILCRPSSQSAMEGEMSHDVTTNLRSELAALQYKRERLLSELQETKGKLNSRDQRVLELQAETEKLREQAARQNAIIASLKKRIHDLEEREQSLNSNVERSDVTIQNLQRDNRYQGDRIKDLEQKVRTLEIECSSEGKMKETSRRAMQDFVHRLSNALGSEILDSSVSSPESLVHRASELVQETARLRVRSGGLSESLSGVEIELRGCRESLDRALADRENIQRQAASHLMEIDRLRQEKESLELRCKVLERESNDLREQLASATRSLGNTSGDLAKREAAICQLRDEVKIKEERASKAQGEVHRILEVVAAQLSTQTHFVEARESSIRERISELLLDIKEKTAEIDTLRDKVGGASLQLTHQVELGEQASRRIRNLEDDRALLESRLRDTEGQLATLEVARDSLRREKTSFNNFIERLSRALGMDEISRDAGDGDPSKNYELSFDSLLLRAEQLARLESDKLVDKTAAVYQLQRRVRTLREQLQRRDLHLDLLRRKISLQEESTRIRSILEGERDNANLRVKKLLKQVERLQLQLTEERDTIKSLKSQLADAADYKITSLERGRKVEDLQKKLAESELLRTRYNRKMALLKDQVRSTSEVAEQDRNMNDRTIQMLRDELASVKQALADTSRRENQLINFRSSIAKLAGVDPMRCPLPDYEIVSRLQKIVHAHREYSLVSRRYEDPRLLSNTGGGNPGIGLDSLGNVGGNAGAPSPTGGGLSTGGLNTSGTRARSRCYDDSGFVDPPDFSASPGLLLDDDIFPDDNLSGAYNKRPLRST
ncbi:coiled-coil domain-containing protein 170 [Ischnura elegans]|uniref:coiled-coil domain-containing protein 170 n=1 Tax=Ischnura elegans TaxID=197161 RepID=UPI001ED89C8D|nr:coiled-coil domain-containing protein 170 [Ischnura elegans]